MSKELRTFARIPVDGSSYSVTDPEGNVTKPQVKQEYKQNIKNLLQYKKKLSSF